MRACPRCAYEDMDAAMLREERDRWTLNCLDRADELVNAIDQGDLARAAAMGHAYKQAKTQLRKVRYAMRIGVA